MNADILQSLNVGAVIRETDCSAVGMSFSADGTALGVGYEDGSVFVIDPDTAHVTRTHRSHKYGLSNFAFLNSDPRGVLAIAVGSAEVDTSIRIWDLSSNRFCRIFRDHKTPVTTVSPHSSEGIFLSSSAEGVVHMWDVRMDGASIWTTLGNIGCMGNFDLHYGSNFVAISTPTRRCISIFDQRKMEKPVTQFQFNTDIDELVFSGDKIIVGSEKLGTITTLASNSGKTVSLYFVQPTKGKKLRIAVSPCAQYALASSANNQIDIWNIQTRIKVRSLSGHGGPPIAKFSPKHTLIASASLPIALWVPFPHATTIIPA